MDDINGTYLQLHMDGMPMALFQSTVTDLAEKTDRQTDMETPLQASKTPAVFSVKSHKKSIQREARQRKS